MTEPIKSIAAADARANFSDILAQAYYQNRLFVVKKSRKPVAVVIGIDQFRALQQAAKQGQSQTQNQPEVTTTSQKDAKVATQPVNKILSVSY